MAAIELDATVVDLPLEEEVIVVNVPKKKRATKPKVEKPKVEKPKKEVLPKCDVPKRNSQIQSIHWMRHVYDMMVEAQVSITPEVIEAYNQVIRFLEGYTTTRIRGPPNRSKYFAGIQPQSREYHNWSAIHIRMPYTTTHIQRNAFIKDLNAVYQPLFNLISDKVLPYMKMKSEIEDAHNKLEMCKRDIRTTHEHIEKEVIRHTEMMKYYSERILQLQKEVERYQTLADMSP
jgi:hypothetical protein